MESRTNGKTPGRNKTLLQEHTSPAVYFLLSAHYSVPAELPGLSSGNVGRGNLSLGDRLLAPGGRDRIIARIRETPA